MSNYDYEDDDFDTTDGGDLVKQLRKATKAKDKELAELKAQYESLAKANRERAINATIQGQLANVVSSSTQVKPLLPGGTVTSSAASSPSQGTVRISINGVDTDVDTGLQTGDSPSLTGLTVTGLNASQAVFTNGSDALVSNAITGTGNVVMSASPTLTGTIMADKMVMSGSQFAGKIS